MTTAKPDKESSFLLNKTTVNKLKEKNLFEGKIFGENRKLKNF